jgi:hypothetical protein
MNTFNTYTRFQLLTIVQNAHRAGRDALAVVYEEITCEPAFADLNKTDLCVLAGRAINAACGEITNPKRSDDTGITTRDTLSRYLP